MLARSHHPSIPSISMLIGVCLLDTFLSIPRFGIHPILDKTRSGRRQLRQTHDSLKLLRVTSLLPAFAFERGLDICGQVPPTRESRSEFILLIRCLRCLRYSQVHCSLELPLTTSSELGCCPKFFLGFKLSTHSLHSSSNEHPSSYFPLPSRYYHSFLVLLP
ncbi:hypothetical protein VTI74DRAFT_2235 [Chaetomium olivicolor]